MRNFCYLSPKVISGIDGCKTRASPKDGVGTEVETSPRCSREPKVQELQRVLGVWSLFQRAAEKSPPQLLLHLTKSCATPSAGAEPGSAPTNVLPPRQELLLQLPPPNCLWCRSPASPHLSTHIFSVHDAHVDLHNLLKGQRERSWCTTIA